MKIKITDSAKKEVEPDVLKVYAKCSDCCSIRLIDKSGEELIDHDGYVPKFFPGNHYGDYLIFNIDVETGQIRNWKKPTEQDLVDFIEEDASP